MEIPRSGNSCNTELEELHNCTGQVPQCGRGKRREHSGREIKEGFQEVVNLSCSLREEQACGGLKVEPCTGTAVHLRPSRPCEYGFAGRALG